MPGYISLMSYYLSSLSLVLYYLSYINLNSLLALILYNLIFI